MKKITMCLFVIIFSLIIATNVCSAESISLKSTKDTVYLGDEITITLNLNIEEKKETSLLAYTAKLSYDKDVFEVIEKDNFKQGENWSDITYNQNNNKFALINKKGITGENILEIKLKVKNDAIPGKTNITVNSITTSNGKKDIPLEENTVEINVIKNELGESNSINKENNISEISEENSAIEIGKDYSYVAYILIILMIIIVVFAIYYYIKSKTSKKQKVIVVSVSIISIIVLLIITINVLSNKKADVNNDGEINYDDTKDIIEYLLEIKGKDENENISDMDINNDGQITISDVAQATKQAKNQDNKANITGTNNTKKKSTNQSNVGNSNNTNQSYNQPEKPENSSIPSNPSSPSTPNNPGRPSRPSEPSNPSTPNNPSNPSSPSTPNDPGRPSRPSEPSTPDNPENPSDPVQPDNPTKPSEPSEPEDYKFTLENLIVTKVDTEQKQIHLQFTSTNASEDYYVSEVVINGNTYNVVKEGTNYTLIIPYENETRKVLELQKARLNNLYEFDNLQKQVVVFKTKPTANVETQIDNEQKVITAKINLSDEDSTVTNLEARLINPKGERFSQLIDKSIEELTFKAQDEEMLKAGEYIIEIGADYEAVDGKTHNTKETIGSTNAKILTKANITNAEVQNYYVSKGENVNIKYTFTSNNYNKPAGININDTFYPITENEDGTYTAAIPAEKTGYGEKSHTVKIAMYGNETVILENTKDAKYYLLKDRPSIENYTFNEFVKEQTLTFNLKNSENAIIKNANVVLTKDSKEVLSEELNTQNPDGQETVETTISLKDVPNGIYKLSLSGTYDLDDDETNGENTHNLSEIFEEREILVTSTYTAELSIKNVEILNEKARVTFNTTNSSNADVKKIIVDGVEYEVSKLEEPNTYTADIPCENEVNQTKKITAVVIEHNIQIDLEEEQSYEVFKTKPKVTDVSTTLNETNLSVSYKFNDQAKIAKNIKVVITKGDFREEKEITPNDKNDIQVVEIENITQAGEYNVEFFAEFDRVDGKGYKQEKISEGDIKFSVEIKPTITLSSISNNYPSKGEQITITYNITSNTQEHITAITVDETEYEISNENYTVTLNAPNNYGDKTYKVTKIKFGDKQIDVSNEDAKIYVLKDAPVINNYNLNKETNTITFNVDNPEEAIIEGNVKIIHEKDGKEIQSQEIKNGTNEIKLEKDQYIGTDTYNVVLDGKYDLDNNENNNENEHDLSELFKEEFQLVIETVVNFDNFETHYPQKGAPVKITFNVNTNTLIPVSQIYVNDQYYDATPAENGKYQITYTAKKESGIENIKVNKIKHGDNEIDVKEVTDRIDVLKSMPKVPFTYEIDENYEEKTITFKFTVEDIDNVIEEESAFVTLGGGRFYDENGKNEIPIKIGEPNEVTFVDVEEKRVFMLDVIANFDLDTNQLNESLGGVNENYYERKALIRAAAMLIPPSILDIKEIKAQDVETDERSSYINKNKDFKLSFISNTLMGDIDGERSPYYPVSAKIGDKTYELTKNGDIYTTTEALPGYPDAGKKEIVIDSITLNNNEILEEDIKANVEVLKDKLKVNNFKVDTETGKAMASYELVDNDKSFVSGKIVLTENETGIQSEIQINKEQTSYDLGVTPIKKYKAELFITYDLDEDNTNLENQYEESFGTANVELITDYELVLNNLQVTNVNKERNTATLQFTSTNVTDHKLKSVIIDGEEYNVVTTGESGSNTYTFEYKIDSEKIGQRTEIKIGTVKLDNEIEVTVDKDNVAVIFKTTPTVQNIQLETEENTKIKVRFDLTDNDNTLKYLYVILKNENGNIVAEQSIEPNDKKTIETKFDVTEANKYKVEVKGEFDLIDGEIHEEDFIAESEDTIEIIPVAQITTENISNKYPNKNDTIEIKYSILSNTASKPIKLTMNNSVEYDLTQDEINKNIYKITYNASNDAGLVNLDVTKIYFENGKIVELSDSHKDQIEILKDKPSFNITSTDYIEGNTVLFSITVTDKDNAITSAKASFHGEEKELQKGLNSWNVNVNPDEEHTLLVEIEYDLDEDQLTLNTENDDNIGKLTESKNFMLVSDYDFKITDINAFKKENNEPSKYFNKNEQIQLRFNSTNKTSFIPEKIVVKDLNSELEGIEYDVKRFAEKNNGYEYYVDINTNSISGTQELQIASVKLNSSKIINKEEFKGDNPKVPIVILKDKPTMLNYTSSNSENTLTVKFEIVDEDNALRESKVNLIETATNSVVKTSNIIKGQNTHIFRDLVPGTKYTIKVENNYSLSDDKQNDGNDIVKEEQIEITNKEQSDFKLKNLTISKRVPTNEKVHISFENGVMSYKDVDTITIDNKTYQITKGSDSLYKLDIDPGNKGINIINIKNVSIGDKVFDINRNLSYVHEKNVPEAFDVSEISEDINSNSAIITYKIKDEDESIKSLKAYMKNSAGSVVATQDITDYNKQDENTLSMPLLKGNTYSIELKANSDIGDGKTYEEKSLFQKEKKSEPRVKIIEQSIDKEYVNKGEKVVLTFKIVTNVDQEVKKIYIDEDSYNVEKVKDEEGKIIEDTYQITVTAPKESGIFEKRVSKVSIGPNLPNAIYGEDVEPINIKVLKDKPSLTHFIIDEKNNVATFRVNDANIALSNPKPRLIIKNGEDVIYNEEITKNVNTIKDNEGYKEYEYDLNKLKMEQVGTTYNVTVNATYDLKPDEPQKMNILQKIMNLFKPNTISEETREDTESEQIETIKTENIFEQDIELTGDIEYNLEFEDVAWYYFSMRMDTEIRFNCSTGTKYKVSKLIIDGKEYPTRIVRDNGNYNYRYEVLYRPYKYDQTSIMYDKLILENGVSIDLNKTAICMVQQMDPTFDITEFSEDTINKKVRFDFKLVDDDYKLASDLTFTLMDSQNKLLEEKVVSRDDNSVEFNIPDPPTSIYNLKVTAKIYEIYGYDEFTPIWDAHDGKYQSSINTSILGCSFSSKYPKKGETIKVCYDISSTKVITVDIEDHENQDKAVGIESLVINGKDYDVQVLGDEKYEIYYTAGNEEGIEKLDVTQIKFTNGDVENFTRTDEIDVLKDAPKISNYRTENKLDQNKVKFIFDVEDNDAVLGADSIYAKLNDVEKPIEIGHNEIEFDVNLDELLKFEIKGTYDLDTDKLKNETEGDDNSYIDYTIFERYLMLTGDYGIKFNNIETYNTKGEKTEFFEKNEDIKLKFTCDTKSEFLYPEKIGINGVEYTPEKNSYKPNEYMVTIKGSENAGRVNIQIESVTLNSGNFVTIPTEQISYEILKDPVKVKEFKYYIGENADKVNLNINIEDIDNANKDIRIEIQDEYKVPIQPSLKYLKVGSNNVTFEKTSAEKYFITVYSNYDRDKTDNDNKNNFDNTKIHYQIVTLNTRYIEMKDIVDIQLYKFGYDGKAEKVYSLTEDNVQVLENCLVKVTMKDIVPFYSNITDYDIVDGKLKLVLAYTDAMVYTENKELKPLEVTLDILNDGSEGYKYSGSFKSLVEEMREKPTGTFELDKDYDLDDYLGEDNSEAIINFEFKGKLNGNGHTISNLHKPLFKNIREAKINNIVFKGVSFINSSSQSAVAVNSYNSEITNIHIDGIVVHGGNNNSAFVVNLNQDSLIDSCSAVNIMTYASYYCQNNAGAVVSLNNSTISNCYVQGRISSGWQMTGGLVAQANNGNIYNNIVDMSVTPYFSHRDGMGNGGITSASKGVTTLKNNLSLLNCGNNIYAVYNAKGYTISSDSINNYQLADTTSEKNEGIGIGNIERENINTEFFERLGFDKEKWNIENATFNNLPKLKSLAASYDDNGYKPKNSEVYIPDYERLCNLSEYKPEKEITYHNVYKLMPFYDAKEILRDGNKIPENNELSTKLIKYIIPYNKSGKMVSNLTTENYNSLDKIKIVFEDNVAKEYHIDFDDYYGNVASYMIADLNIGYNYNKFIINPNIDIIQKLIKTASDYDFTRDLDPVTPKADSRLYKEHYEKETKNHIQEFVINTLVNMGYMPNFESEVLNELIIQDIIDSGKLKELLFAYNYFTYWYNLDMDGINLADAVMFHSNEMFAQNMTFSNISNELISGTNSNTSATGGFYNNNLAKYTKLSNLGLFLDYFVTTLTDYTDGNQWFIDHWKGGRYYTISIDVKDVDYTIWDHVKKDGKVQNDFLPLFTVPENSMYVISSPTQAYFGSLRVYMKDPTDVKQIEEFEKKIKVFSDQVKAFYTFAYTYWGKDVMNKYCDVNYDMRTTYTGKGEDTVYNNPLTTQENYHKYFTEAVDRWSKSIGGAYANGNEVYWTIIKMLDSFRVGTHETLHNQDSKIFLNGYGRRGGAEDYAAGFLQQYYRDGWVSPNIFDEEPQKDNQTQNLRLSSVATPDKLYKFYNKYFRVNDYLDWIEAKAFLELTAEQQAKLSVQVSYPKVDEEHQDEGDDVVAYTPLTTDRIEKMQLNTIDDLWDNKIMLRPGVKQYEQRSPGADTDSIFNIHWYQPHADNDRPDGANFKYLAWQMAGEKGYYDGLCAYYSLSYVAEKTNRPGLKTTDIIALRYIMDDENITFREYKLNRYKELAKYYDVEGTYIDAKKIYDEYLQALIKDAERGDRSLASSTGVKKKYFKQIREETNDFQIDPFSQKNNIEKTSVVIEDETNIINIQTETTE